MARMIFLLQGKQMKKVILAIAMTSLSVAAMAQAKELKVAIDPTYEPFTFKTPDGKPTGFDVDIANAVCEQVKRKCVFVEQVWDSMIPGLQAKKYDVIISSMSITEDRLKVVDFTEAQDQVYLDIKAGRLDGTVADVLEVQGGFLSKPEGKDYGLVGPELYIPKYFGTGAGFAIRKGDAALKGELNGAIKAIRANGTYKKINDKYFKIDVYGK